MTQQAQAQGLHRQGVQLFEEARRGLTDALGRMSEASQRLQSGELTETAAATWREKFDAAYTDAKALKERAAGLANLSQGLQTFEHAERRPRYLHPNADGVWDLNAGDAGDQPTLPAVYDEDGQPVDVQALMTHRALGGELPENALQLGHLGPNGGTSQVGSREPVQGLNEATTWADGDPRDRILLNNRSRYLLNQLLRGEKFGGCTFRSMKPADRHFLSKPRRELLMSPYVERDGGMITAEEVRNEVIGHIRDVLYIRSRARVIATTEASVAFPSAKITLRLKKTRAGRGTGTDPVKLRKVFGKTRFVPSGESETVLVPEELLEDATFDVVGFLAEEIAMNDLEHEEEQFLIGTGSGEPLGVLTALEKLDAAGYGGLGFNHSGASGADFTADDLKRFPYKLRKAFRAGGDQGGAVWTANKAWIEKVSVMRTEAAGAGTQTGDYLFRSGTEAGDPDAVVGYPFLESEFFPDNIASGSAGDPLCLFGSWRHYWIVDRKSLDIRVLLELYSATDEVGYKYSKRFDAAPVRAEAWIYMKRK